MIFIGLDPGVNTGYSVIRYHGGYPVEDNCEILTSGEFRADIGDPFSVMLNLERLKDYVPDDEEVIVGVENQYMDPGKVQAGKKRGGNFQSMKGVMVTSGMLILGAMIIFGVVAQRPYPSSWQSRFGISGKREQRKRQAKKKVLLLFGLKAKTDRAEAILISVYLAM